jgi:hypothetical protein
MKQTKTFMDQQTTQTQKRPRSGSSSDGGDAKKSHKNNSETESDTEQVENWQRFFVLAPKDKARRLDSLSPFLIEKTIKAMVGTVKSAKPLRSGDLLVEVANKAQASHVAKLTKLGTIDIESNPHRSLNIKKGVVRCHQFQTMTETDLLQHLAAQAVTEVKRIQVSRGGKKENTNTYVLTFTAPKLPEYIKAGYLRVPVSPYIPNPLRCFKCQKYGHHQGICRRTIACQVCSQEGHDTKECNNPPRCCNCGGEHSPGARLCPTWEREKQINTIKVQKNISFPEARRCLEMRNAAGPVTYAQAAAAAPSSKTPMPSKKLTSTSTQTDITGPIMAATAAAQTQTGTVEKTPTSSNKPGPASSKPTQKVIINRVITKPGKKPTIPVHKQKTQERKKGVVDVEIHPNSFDLLEDEDPGEMEVTTSPRSSPKSPIRGSPIRRTKNE